MSSLKALQEEMKSLVFYRDEEKCRSYLWKDGVPPRIDVYRNNARLNWSDALDADFPLTRRQFPEDVWGALKKRYFIKYPPASWELNASLTPFGKFLAAQKVKPFIKELADYEWHDLAIFISRAHVTPGSGVTNPTAVVRVYQHEILDWVKAGASSDAPPRQKPQVLVFYRDAKNACHVRVADPLMLLLMEHFRKPNQSLEELEPTRRELLPGNKVPLRQVYADLLGLGLLL